jgi:hypothetical protein
MASLSVGHPSQWGLTGVKDGSSSNSRERRFIFVFVSATERPKVFNQFRLGNLEKQLTAGLSYSQVNAWTHGKSARMRGSPTPALPKAAAQWEVAVAEAGNLRLGRADLKEKAAQCEPRTTSMSPLRWGD